MKNILVYASGILALLIFSNAMFVNNKITRHAFGDEATSDTLKDPRDGKIYGTLTIGTQTWMTENLRYDMTGSKCYKNSANNCETYGRLYSWELAQKACPEGWHLPSMEEWQQLIGNFANNQDAYAQLIKGGSTGFNATLHGIYGLSTNQFVYMKEHGAYWSSTSFSESHAWAQRFMFNTTETYSSQAIKANGQACRCVKN